MRIKRRRRRRRLPNASGTARQPVNRRHYQACCTRSRSRGHRASVWATIAISGGFRYSKHPRSSAFCRSRYARPRKGPSGDPSASFGFTNPGMCSISVRKTELLRPYLAPHSSFLLPGPIRDCTSFVSATCPSASPKSRAAPVRSDCSRSSPGPESVTERFS